MHAQTPKKPRKKSRNTDKLAKIEWDIIDSLKEDLQQPNLSTADKVRLSNAIAYHASNLNKMQSEKGEKPPFNETTLGDYVKSIKGAANMVRIIRRDFRRWTKKLSSKK